MISKKKRLEIGIYGLKYQYGKLKFNVELKKLFNKNENDLSLIELDLLAQNLHKKGVFKNE